MAQNPDPNRWVPPEPGAAEDAGPGDRERQPSARVRWGIVATVVLLVVVALALMA
jgi:hypothetical protein